MPVDKSGENPHFSATPYYDDYYAIWDTYRTSMPLLTLIEEPQQRDMVNSLLNIYKHDGYMPMLEVATGTAERREEAMRI